MTPEHAAPDDAAPTWRASEAAWWAMAVIVTAVAVAGFTALRTLSVASDEEFAPVILATVLEEPTRDAIDTARSELGPDDESVRVREDLVAFTLPADLVRDDPVAARHRAVDQRVEVLRDEGIPVDPGPDRTPTGLPRVVIESMSTDNHEVVAGKTPLAAAVVIALLAWTLLLARRDNLLVLPAAALAGGWLLTVALTEAARIALDDAGPSTATVFRLLEAAGSEPRRQLAVAAVFGLGAAAAYRLAVLALNRWDRTHADTPAVVHMELVEESPIAATTSDTGAPDRRIRVYARRPAIDRGNPVMGQESVPSMTNG